MRLHLYLNNTIHMYIYTYIVRAADEIRSTHQITNTDKIETENIKYKLSLFL